MFKHLNSTQNVCPTLEPILEVEVMTLEPLLEEEDCGRGEIYYQYQSLLYSLMTNIGVEFIGGILFFITAIYIVKDKLLCEAASSEAKRLHNDGSGVRLMMTPTNYSPEDSLEDLPSDQERPKLKLFITDDISSSRSPSPP